MGCCIVIRDMYSCLIILHSFFDVWGRLEELLKVSPSPLWFTLCHLRWGWLSNCIKVPDWGYTPGPINGMLFCYGRYPLRQECSIIFHKCIMKIARASDIISKPIMVHTIPFWLMLTLKLHTKSRIFGTLSAHVMRWCTEMRYIHCCWSASYSSLDV